MDSLFTLQNTVHVLQMKKFFKNTEKKTWQSIYTDVQYYYDENITQTFHYNDIDARNSGAGRLSLI